MTFFYRLLAVFVLVLSTQTMSYGQFNALNTAQNVVNSKTVTSVENIVSKTSEYVDKIQAAVDKVESGGLYKSLIDGKEFSFPIAILPNDGNKQYALILNKVFITSASADVRRCNI